jgi:hypothetical protein
MKRWLSCLAFIPFPMTPPNASINYNTSLLNHYLFFIKCASFVCVSSLESLPQLHNMLEVDFLTGVLFPNTKSYNDLFLTLLLAVTNQNLSFWVLLYHQYLASKYLCLQALQIMFNIFMSDTLFLFEARLQVLMKVLNLQRFYSWDSFLVNILNSN